MTRTKRQACFAKLLIEFPIVNVTVILICTQNQNDKDITGKKNSWAYGYIKNKLDDLQTQLIRLTDVNFKTHHTSCFTELTANLF